MLYVLTRPVKGAESLTLPFWLGNGAQHRREAALAASETTAAYQTLLFAYTVQPGDADSDGIYLGENPFGDNADASLHREENAAVPAHILRAADQLPADQSVDGNNSRSCTDILCSTATVGGGTAGPLQRPKRTGLRLDIPAWHHPIERWGSFTASTFSFDGSLYALEGLYLDGSTL